MILATAVVILPAVATAELLRGELAVLHLVRPGETSPAQAEILEKLHSLLQREPPVGGAVREGGGELRFVVPALPEVAVLAAVGDGTLAQLGPLLLDDLPLVILRATSDGVSPDTTSDATNSTVREIILVAVTMGSTLQTLH